MGLLKSLIDKSPVVGWVSTPVLFHSTSGPWRPEKGYTICIVIIRLTSKQMRHVDFQAESSQLRLDDGEEIMPIGIIPCLHRGFRGVDGQPIPPVLSTNVLKFNQEAGEAIGYTYGIDINRSPKAVLFNGEWHGPIKALDDDTVPIENSGSGEVKLKVLSNATLLDHIPFCDPDNALNKFSEFRHPVHRHGILAIGESRDHSIVSVRIPQKSLESLKTVDTEKIEAKLRDGKTIKAAGVVISSPDFGSPPPTPYAILDKGQLSSSGKQMRGGATCTFLYDFNGPTSGFSFADCKIVAAFDKAAAWDNVESVTIGNYTAAPDDGTVIYSNERGVS